MLQFSQEICPRVMITSEDSKVRVFDGVDVVNKFKGKNGNINSLGVLGDTLLINLFLMDVAILKCHVILFHLICVCDRR